MIRPFPPHEQGVSPKGDLKRKEKAYVLLEKYVIILHAELWLIYAWKTCRLLTRNP